MHSFEAIYRGGVFRPLNEISLTENQRVRLTVELEGEPNLPKPIQTAQDLIESNVVGIWSNRDDICDSREFATRLRQDVETQRGQNHVAR